VVGRPAPASRRSSICCCASSMRRRPYPSTARLSHGVGGKACARRFGGDARSRCCHASIGDKHPATPGRDAKRRRDRRRRRRSRRPRVTRRPRGMEGGRLRISGRILKRALKLYGESKANTRRESDHEESEDFLGWTRRPRRSTARLSAAIQQSINTLIAGKTVIADSRIACPHRPHGPADRLDTAA